jgi:hypothetical protein
MSGRLIAILMLLGGALAFTGCVGTGGLREIMPAVVAGEPDPHYRGGEHLRLADAVVVAVVRNTVAHGRSFPSQFSSAIFLQEKEIVIEPEYVLKGEIAGTTLSVRANLLS